MFSLLERMGKFDEKLGGGEREVEGFRRHLQRPKASTTSSATLFMAATPEN